MNPLTAEWIAKAEADYKMAAREVAALDCPNWDGVCFHAQQSAEKYIKAVLQERDTPIARIHDLRKLVGLVSPPLPDLVAMARELDALSQSAVSARYPGYFADEQSAHQALAIAGRVRSICRRVLSLAET
jgi:HEPN domain-containing protein